MDPSALKDQLGRTFVTNLLTFLIRLKTVYPQIFPKGISEGFIGGHYLKISVNNSYVAGNIVEDGSVLFLGLYPVCDIGGHFHYMGYFSVLISIRRYMDEVITEVALLITYFFQGISHHPISECFSSLALPTNLLSIFIDLKAPFPFPRSKGIDKLLI
jgi:hypothetical protein